MVWGQRRAGLGRARAIRARVEVLACPVEDRLGIAWLHLFLVHAHVNQGPAGPFMTEGPEAAALDCHQVIMDTAAGLLSRAQQAGTARSDLDPADLVQLIVGIALATARSGDADQADRLLTLALDAVRRQPGAPAN
jgi:hypothetical protein